MGVTPQVSKQIFYLPVEYMTGRHSGFIVGELVFRWDIRAMESFVVFLGKPIYYHIVEILAH